MSLWIRPYVAMPNGELATMMAAMLALLVVCFVAGY